MKNTMRLICELPVDQASTITKADEAYKNLLALRADGLVPIELIYCLYSHDPHSCVNPAVEKARLAEGVRVVVRPNGIQVFAPAANDPT